jgi:F-type H+-transporting ATPase subunit a
VTFLAAQPGSHHLTPICGDGYWNLVVVKFYYCAFTLDTLVSSGIAIAVTMALAFTIASRLRPGVPGKLQMLLEFVVSYVRGTVLASVADDAGFIVPLAVTIGFYIFVANWLDILPLGFSPLVYPATADLNQTLAMALVVFFIVQWYAFRIGGARSFFSRFTKPFPALIPLKIVEELVKPVSLSLRLFGNLFAGLLMVYLITLIPNAFPSILPISVPVAALLLIAWKAFDVFFVGTIQAFIFMLLTIIYFSQAREGLGEEHEAHTSHPRRADTAAAPPVPQS